MISKKDILKMVRHVSRRSRGVPDRRLIHPRREWSIGLWVFVLIVVVGSIYDFSLYRRLDTLQQEIEVPESGVVMYKENSVAEALERFRSRKTAYDTLLTAGIGTRPVAETPETPVATSTESVTEAAASSALEVVPIETASSSESEL